MQVCAVVNDTYEPKGAGWDYPVVRHIFYGRTCKEAMGYSKAHKGTDVFYRDCNEDGKYKTIECPSYYSEEWVAPIPAPSSGTLAGAFGDRRSVAWLAAVGLVAGAAVMVAAWRQRHRV